MLAKSTGVENGTRIRRAWFAPVFSSLLEHRLEGLTLVGFGALQVGLYLLGLPGWVCPFKAVFGIPCPGCGLTAALDELLRGHVLASLRTHAFAPIFLAAVLILLVSILLPEKQREKLIATIARLETRTGFTAWVLIWLMLYWGIRLFGLV
jgi:hypothetical protein